MIMPTAIITGATQGIGAAIARKLATERFSLCICARSDKDLLLIKSELEILGSPQVYTLAVDLSNKESATKFGIFALECLVNVDILVNNAGIFIPGNICEEPEGQMEQMMQLNVFAPYAITRIIVPTMKQKSKGHIINICSVASLKSYAQGGSYSISKYALLGFSDNLRQELMPNHIKVTSICPGATYSRSWENSGIERERLIPAEDVANIVWTAYNLSASTDLETIIVRPQFGDL